MLFELVAREPPCLCCRLRCTADAITLPESFGRVARHTLRKLTPGEPGSFAVVHLLPKRCFNVGMLLLQQRFGPSYTPTLAEFGYNVCVWPQFDRPRDLPNTWLAKILPNSLAKI